MDSLAQKLAGKTARDSAYSRRTFIQGACAFGLGVSATGTLPAESAAATGASRSPVASPARPGPSASIPSGLSIVNGTLNWAIPSEPATTDPAIDVGGPSYRLLVQIYEGLLSYSFDGDAIELAPALAESWTVADDGTSIDFKLRPNTKFHDGTTLDAETIKASIERTASVNRGGAFFLRTLKEVQIIDPMTVRLVATGPSVSLLYGLPKVYIMGKAHMSDPDNGEAFFASNTNGTGPYKLTRWEKGQQFVLDQFEDYWGGWEGDHVAQVIQRVVPEAGTQQLLMENGDIDLAFLPSIGIAQDPQELVAQNPGLQMVESKAYRVTVISINSQKGPLQDVRVRRALQLAFDYEAMGEIYQGYAEVPSQPLPKDFTEAFDPSLPVFQQDLEQAKQLLAEAGYPNGGFTIEFFHSDTEPQARLAGLLIQATLQQLGITVNLQGIPFATLVAQVANLETAPDMHATLTMTPRTADPGELLSTLYASANAGQAYNYGWYSNPEVDELLAQADQTFDNAERMELYRQVVRKVMDDAASIWAAYPRLVEVMRVEVQNYQYNPLNYTGVFPCYPIWLDE